MVSKENFTSPFTTTTMCVNELERQLGPAKVVFQTVENKLHSFSSGLPEIFTTPISFNYVSCLSLLFWFFSALHVNGAFL